MRGRLKLRWEYVRKKFTQKDRKIRKMMICGKNEIDGQALLSDNPHKV